MKLPSIDTYAFPVVLPSSQKTIAMRPFLVREEKLLLMAQESKNLGDQIEAVAQVIRNCTNNEIDPHVVPFFDIEYLLLQLRIRSVGEVVNPVYQCNNTFNGVLCGNPMTLKIDLNEVKVTNLNAERTMTVSLSPKYVLHLRYPTIYAVTELLNSLADNEQVYQKAIESITNIFDTLVDTETNTVFRFDDYTTEEKLEFLESIETSIYNKILEFLNTMPKVRHQTTYTCDRCGFAHELLLEGLQDFLL